MVDDRRAAVLRAVVQQYIETSQPVSSGSIAGRAGVNASSATIRAVMAELENDGYLFQPHASAGRIPTDRGYRFYVDSMEKADDLELSSDVDVRQFFEKAHGEIEGMMHEAGRLLTDLTGSASLVVGPEHKEATVRSAQVVRLSERSAIVVVVLADGVVEKCTIDMGRDTTEQQVEAASRALAAALDGRELGAQGVDIETGDTAVDRIAITALAALRGAREGAGRESVYVGGTSAIASSFDAVEVVRNVLTILEKQYVVVSLMRDLLDRGVNVSIGGENKLESLEHCSLVIAPTVVDGEQFGSVAVLGPTRMNYSRALAAVSVVSSNLGRRLEGS